MCIALLGLGVGLIVVGTVRSGPSIVKPISTANAASPVDATRPALAVASESAEVPEPVVAAESIEDQLILDDTPEPPATEAAIALSRQLLIDAAIGRGEIERHDDMVYVLQDKATFAASTRACEELAIADANWRLANIGELHALVRAKQLPRVSYWSGTEVEEFGTRALAWHGRYMRASPIGKLWRGARGVCVLDETPGPDAL